MTRGTLGEDIAAQLLERKGFTILDRNWRTRAGELDVVAADGRYLVFAEVKLRADSRHGAAREFVTPAKQRRILAAAGEWLAAHETTLQPRFDVIEIYLPRGAHEPSAVQHLENAFEACF